MSNDIEHRAFWNLPAPGIIERHYGTEGHAGDTAEYYNHIHRNNYPQGTFVIDTGKIEKGETENPFANRKEFINKLFNGYQIEIPKGNYQVSYGGMLAGKTHKRKQDEFIQAMLYGGSKKTNFEKAIESVADKNLKLCNECKYYYSESEVTECKMCNNIVCCSCLAGFTFTNNIDFDCCNSCANDKNNQQED